MVGVVDKQGYIELEDFLRSCWALVMLVILLAMCEFVQTAPQFLPLEVVET